MANSIAIALKLGRGLLVLLLIHLQFLQSIAEPLDTTKMLPSTSPRLFTFSDASTESTTTTWSMSTQQKKLTKTIPTLSSSFVSTASTSLTFLKDNRQNNMVRESVVIPSGDSEREAQELYDKALQQYGSFELSFRQICSEWELRGCKCSGTIDELTLICRDVGLQEIPNKFPVNIVKL